MIGLEEEMFLALFVDLLDVKGLLVSFQLGLALLVCAFPSLRQASCSREAARKPPPPPFPQEKPQPNSLRKAYQSTGLFGAAQKKNSDKT